MIYVEDDLQWGWSDHIDDRHLWTLNFCQCQKQSHSLTFVDSAGQVQGNCRTVDSTGARWCYTSHGSTCQVCINTKLKCRFPRTFVWLSKTPGPNYFNPLPVQPVVLRGLRDSTARLLSMSQQYRRSIFGENKYLHQTFCSFFNCFLYSYLLHIVQGGPSFPPSSNSCDQLPIRSHLRPPLDAHLHLQRPDGPDGEPWPSHAAHRQLWPCFEWLELRCNHQQPRSKPRRNWRGFRSKRDPHRHRSQLWREPRCHWRELRTSEGWDSSSEIFTLDHDIVKFKQW